MMSYRCHARLGSIERHVSAASGAEAVEAPAQLKLLTDDQLQQFLGRGYLMLQAEELGPAFHQALFENAKAEYGPDADEGPPGASHGTTVERVPGLTTLIESPTVAGALQSLLGPDYAHGHLGATGCAFHASGGPGGPGQPFHKDTQRGHICGHRTRNVMVMYYPGSAEEDSGPTAIVPSSHILARDGLGLSYGVIDDGPKGAEDRGDWGGLGGRAEILSKIAPELFEHKVVVPASEAGSVCVVHEDMVHRGTPRDAEDMFRPMFKWSFTRLHEPSAPSWRHDPSAPAPAASDWPALVAPEAGAICESIWRWHKGEATGLETAAAAAAVDTAALGGIVLAPPRDGDEAERMGAAYSLGACGSDAALAALTTALSADGNESARRAGSLGLGAAGDRAVATLLRVLDTPGISGLVTGSAVEALGEAAMTPDPAVVLALDAICWAQHGIIAAAEASVDVSEDELPAFSEGNIHINGDLRIPVMLPVACRPIAARYLVIALAQIALGRVSQRWACAAPGDPTSSAAQCRAHIIDALRPWSAVLGASGPPRIRKENGRALFQLCAALASSSATPPSAAEMAEAGELQSVISAIKLVGRNTYLPLAERCLAGMRDVAAQ